MSLGQRIRQLRQSWGLTQSELGGLELSKSFVSLIEKDRARPSVDTLVLIARRLGTSVDALLGQHGHLADSVADGLLTLSRQAIRDHDLDRALALLEAAQFVATTYRVDEAGREVLLQMAEVAMDQRRFADAVGLLDQAQERCNQIRDLWRLGRILLLRGSVKVRERKIPEAVPMLEQALLVLRRARAGRDSSRIETLIMLGTALGYTGDYAAAIRRFEEAVGSQVAQHDPVLRGRALWGIGLAQRKAGDLAVASRYLLKAKDAFESAEELRELMRVLHNLGQLLAELGQPEEALRHFHQALRVMERLKERSNRATILTEIGRVHLGLGHLSDATYFAASALKEAKIVNDPVEVAEASVVLARAHLQRHEMAPAVELLKEALGIFREHGMRGRLAETAKELGLALRRRGAHALAARYLAMSLEEERKEVPPDWQSAASGRASQDTGSNTE